jgi:hypothetical protein
MSLLWAYSFGNKKGMIKKKYRSEPRVIRFAFIEACLIAFGQFRREMLQRTINITNQSGVSTVRLFLAINPGAMEYSTIARAYFVSENFKREILKADTDPAHFLNLVCVIHGTEVDFDEINSRIEVILRSRVGVDSPRYIKELDQRERRPKRSKKNL